MLFFISKYTFPHNQYKFKFKFNLSHPVIDLIEINLYPAEYQSIINFQKRKYINV